MASALDDDEICNDDYYSLLNVRREVRDTLVTQMIFCTDAYVRYSLVALKLIANSCSLNEMYVTR